MSSWRFARDPERRRDQRAGGVVDVARIRQIKPDFFRSEDVANLEPIARLLFVGLWTLADREWRLLDRPRRIAIELFPYDRMDDKIDLLLGSLAARGLIVRYARAGSACIQITGFGKHQKPHPKEPASELPPPPAPEDGQSTHTVGQSHGETRPATDEGAAENVSQHPSRSGSGSLGSGSLVLGSGSMGSGNSPPSAPARDLWAGWQWFNRFRMLWPEAHGKIAYGEGKSDAQATGDLEDKLNSLPGEDRLAAQARADELIAGYFAIGQARPAGHPWKWFVERFNELRIPSPAKARASPPRDHRVGIGRAEDVKHTVTGEQAI